MNAIIPLMVITLAIAAIILLAGMGCILSARSNAKTVTVYGQGSDFNSNGARLIDNPHKMRSERRSTRRTY